MTPMPNNSSSTKLLRRALLMLAAICCGAVARADGPTAKASFSPASATVGETIRFRIEIANADATGLLPRLKVDGLDFDYVGPQTRYDVRFENGSFTRSSTVTHLYQVTPRKEGTFTVPALQIEVNGRVLKTEPVSLNVAAAGAGAGGGGGGNAAAPGAVDRHGRAEFVLPKKSLYVGETVPIELRLLVDAQVRWEIEGPPSFDSEGFTKTKTTEPRSDTVVRNGRTYDVLTVFTAITPTKAGKLTLGPLKFPYRAQIPRAQRRNPTGLGGSLFDDFFNDPFSGFGRVERFTAASEPLELDVKPLPVASRPANFSGAVGQFTLRAEGSPARVKVGDPITMSLSVSGSGNFDRVGAPALAEPAGWRSYPPTSTFKGDDELGIKGTKNFEVAVIPEARKDRMPEFEFAYFDPSSAKYVTLRSHASPLQVDGDALPNPAPRPVARIDTPRATPAPSAPAPKPTDILGIRYDYGRPTAAQALYTQRAFLLAQLVPLGGLLGMVALRFWPASQGGVSKARWQRERNRLLSQLRGTPDREGFYETAARVLQIEGALRTGQPPETVDAHTLARLQGAGDRAKDDASVVDQIFQARAAALYAGTGAPGESAPFDKEERAKVLSALNHWLSRK